VPQACSIHWLGVDHFNSSTDAGNISDASAAALITVPLFLLAQRKAA
jgi:hypothetical protein